MASNKKGAGLDAGSLLPSLGGRVGFTKSHLGLNPVLYLLLNPTASSIAEPHPHREQPSFFETVYVRIAIKHSISDQFLRQ